MSRSATVTSEDRTAHCSTRGDVIVHLQIVILEPEMSHRVEVNDDSHRNAVATEDRQLTVLRSMNILLKCFCFCSNITRQSIHGQLPVLHNCQLLSLYLLYFCICMLMHLGLHCSIVECLISCCNLKSMHCTKISRTVPWSVASVLLVKQLDAISPLGVVGRLSGLRAPRRRRKRRVLLASQTRTE